MKAMVNEKFGPPEVLELKEIEKPIIEDDEILIKTYATSVNMIDIVFRSGMKAMFGLVRLTTGLRKPKVTVLGFDIAGQVVETGKDISHCKIGDRVFGGARTGANAEYAKSTEKAVANIPDNMSYLEAAGIPVVGLTALQALRDSGEIEEDQDVLIYGVSSGTGTYAIQIAKYYGANVTGIASGRNEEIVLNLGADTFIDYTKEDFTQREKKYDLIIDAVGKIPFKKWKKSLKKEGIFVNVGSPSMSMINFLRGLLGNKFRSRKYRSIDTKYRRNDLEFLANLNEEGHLKTIIDTTYPFEELIAAHQQYELGRTVGKIIIEIVSEN